MVGLKGVSENLCLRNNVFFLNPMQNILEYFLCWVDKKLLT